MKNSIQRSALLFSLFLGFLIPEGAAFAAPTSRTNINTAPEGASVYLVNGEEEIFQGNTPMKLHRLPRGNIKLRFKKDGYEDLTQDITIAVRIDTLFFTMKEAPKPAVLTLQSGSDEAGAEVKVDGKNVGSLPLTVEVDAGRHLVQITKEGFSPWEQWIEAEKAQKLNYQIVLKPLAKATGELLVTSSPSEAKVEVDGKEVGLTPTLVSDLKEGPHLVEITKDDYPVFSKMIAVESGQRAILDAELVGKQAETGELKILSNQDGTEVLLDGESVGQAPLTVPNLKPGTHYVEGRAENGFTGGKEAVVRAGESTLVRLVLEQDESFRPGEIVIESSARDAEATLDGGAPQALPTTFKNVSPGLHHIVVEAPGRTIWTTDLEVLPGQVHTLNPKLNHTGVLRVRSGDTSFASELFLNGERLGSTPFTGSIPTGTHSLLVQREDGAQEEFQINVTRDREIQVVASFEEAEAIRRANEPRLFPFSARVLPEQRGHVSGLLSWYAWAFPIAIQAGGGIGHNLDINVQARTAFDVINEVEFKLKYTFVDTKTLAASGGLGIGGGAGGSERNSFILRPILKGTLFMGNIVALTARAEVLYHTDRVGPESILRYEKRDSGVRLYLGLDAEFSVAEMWNVLIQFSGDPLPGSRKLYNESFMSDPTPALYFKAGASFIF